MKAIKQRAKYEHYYVTFDNLGGKSCIVFGAMNLADLEKRIKRIFRRPEHITGFRKSIAHALTIKKGRDLEWSVLPHNA